MYGMLETMENAVPLLKAYIYFNLTHKSKKKPNDFSIGSRWGPILTIIWFKLLPFSYHCCLFLGGLTKIYINMYTLI